MARRPSSLATGNSSVQCCFELAVANVDWKRWWRTGTPSVGILQGPVRQEVWLLEQCRVVQMVGQKEYQVEFLPAIQVRCS